MNRTKNVWMVGLSVAGLMLASAGAASAQDAVMPDKVKEKVTEASESVADANLPDGFELLEKHVKAIGGIEAAKKIEAIRMNATFEMPAMGMSGDLLIQLKGSEKMAVVVELPGMGTIYQGADGEQAWASPAPGMPAVIVEGPQAQALKDQARFRDDYTPREAYASAKTLDKEMFDDEMVYRVELVKKDSDVVTQALFSVDSGLRVADIAKSSPASKVFDLVTKTGDYRKVDDLILFAHKLTVATPQFDQVITINKVEFNPEFEDGTFDPPGGL